MIIFTFLWYWILIGSFVTFASLVFITKYRETIKEVYKVVLDNKFKDANKSVVLCIFVVVNSVIWPLSIFDIINCLKSNDH